MKLRTIIAVCIAVTAVASAPGRVPAGAATSARLTCPSGSPPAGDTTTFQFTGKLQHYVVPATIDCIRIQATGAQGGAFGFGTVEFGGLGGSETADFATTAGEKLAIVAGGQGDDPAQNGTEAGGYGGGGRGGTTSNTSPGGYFTLAAGGGGGSFVSGPTGSLLLAAGGGGGAAAGADEAHALGSPGSGGGPNGLAGAAGAGDCTCSGTEGGGGGGAGPSKGGAGGSAGSSNTGPGAGKGSSGNGPAVGIGNFGVGGTGGSGGDGSAGGGGGGGYFGGGGGGAGDFHGGGEGGGGSGFVSGAGSNVKSTTGLSQASNGSVMIMAYPALQVTGLSPKKSALDAGATVTVTGSGFTGADKIRLMSSEWGKTPPTFGPNDFQVLSDTAISLTMPKNIGDFVAPFSDLAAYHADVVVSVGKETSPFDAGERFTFEAPQVHSLSPRNVPLDVAKPVTITGANFTGATDVIGICTPGETLQHHSHPFGTLHVASSATIKTTASPFMDTRISTDACENGGPAEATYPFGVRVVVGNAFSPSVPADEFTFDGPVIARVFATQKPYLDSGVPITITGTGLDKVDEIVIQDPNTLQSASHVGPQDFLTHTGTQIVFPAPKNVSSVLPTQGAPFTQVRYPLAARVFVGFAKDPGHSANFDFLGPQVAAVSPSFGPLNGGKKITIAGAGFDGATEVWFRLSTNPGKALSLKVGGQVNVSANGQSVTIGKGPDLSSLVPKHGKGPFTFDVAVDIGSAENPPTSADRYKVP